MAADETGVWTKWATFASLATAVGIPVGIIYPGTAIFLMAAGPVALVAGFVAVSEALFRRRLRNLIPAIFAVLLGAVGTFYLVVGIILWSQRGTIPTK